jgi:regulator of protease activity HflC (stomatin/prohibitin superfamily)
MDTWFIFFLIMAAITIAAFVCALFMSKESDYGTSGRTITLRVGVGLAVVSGLLLFMSSFTIVPTKTVGIEAQFGRPGAVLDNGWHWKSPAATIHKFDASLQSDHYSTDKGDNGDPITVRLFTGSQAQVNVTFQWKLEDNANFINVFTNYKDPDNIRTNLVKRALQQALNEVFASYNPYAALIAAQTDSKGQKPAGSIQVSSTSYEDFQRQALDKLRGELGPQGVQATSLTIASIVFDGKTQANLDGLSSAIAQTQIAIQNEATADAQAQANSKLNGSKASGATIQQLCIQATQKVLEEGHTLPAGWSCTGIAPTTVVPTN